MLNILLVENDPGYSGIMEDKLEILKHQQLVIYKSVNNGKHAINLLKSGSYDLVLLDLKLKDGDDTDPKKVVYDGITIGEQIRFENKNVVIFMYSSDIIWYEEEKFDHYISCKSSGADKIISRKELFGYDTPKLFKIFESSVTEKEKKLTQFSELIFDKDIPTDALKEKMTSNNHQDIFYKVIDKLNPEIKKCRISALKEGNSGALVFTVRPQLPDGKYDIPAFVIKACRSFTDLNKEMKALPLVGTPLYLSSAQPVNDEVIEINDWNFIAYPMVEDSDLLSNFLLVKDEVPGLDKTFNQLIQNMLIKPSSSHRDWKDEIKVDSFYPSFSMLNQIVETLAILNSWKDIYDIEIKKDIAELNNFIEKIYKRFFSFKSYTNYLAHLHGDLHCDNIFVSISRPATVIDFGKRCILPRLFDIAAFNVDLLIIQMSKAQGQDQRYDLIKEWETISLEQFPFNDKSKIFSPTNDRVVILRNMLINEMLNKLESVTSHEYSVVLLFNLLRYLKFSEVSNPKKILIIKLVSYLIRKYGFE